MLRKKKEEVSVVTKRNFLINQSIFLINTLDKILTLSYKYARIRSNTTS
jgi:hypothetical protein